MMLTGGAPCQTENTTGMARSVLAEVARMLESLAGDGATGSIDLRSLPLTAADRQQLEDLLGRGEVFAELELAGRSTVWETAYAGVWWIRHRGAEDRISSEEIAVCPVPEILRAHPADIGAAAFRLRESLPESVAADAPPTPGSVAADAPPAPGSVAADAPPALGSVAADAPPTPGSVAADAPPAKETQHTHLNEPEASNG